MSITITYAWWYIPAAVTVVCLLWALLTPPNNVLSDLFEIMGLIIMALLAWAIAGALK